MCKLKKYQIAQRRSRRAIHVMVKVTEETHPIHFRQQSAAFPSRSQARRTDSSGRGEFEARSCQSIARRKTAASSCGLAHTPSHPCSLMMIIGLLVSLSCASFFVESSSRLRSSGHQGEEEANH